MTGTVLTFDPIRGYGRIRGDEDRRPLFVHKGEVLGGRRWLRAGERVSFDVQETPRGPEAVGVTRLAAEAGTTSVAENERDS